MNNKKTAVLVGLGLLGGYLILRPTIYDEFENLNNWQESTQAPDPSCVQAAPTKDNNLTIAKLGLFGSRCKILPGSNQGVNIKYNKETGYGEYSSRLKTGKAGDGEGIATGFYLYKYVPPMDVVEIDVEFLAAEPNSIHLALWNTTWSLLERAIDMKTGTVFMNRQTYIQPDGTWKSYDIPGSPTTVVPISDFDHHNSYYTYGFEWTKNKITWFTYNLQGNKIILWEVTDIKSLPTLLSGNTTLDLWYTNNWGAWINPPTKDTFTYFDWFKYKRL